MALQLQLAAAINEQRLVDLTYDGFHRRVEPHCLGRDNEGQLKLRCWQTQGGSARDPRPGWRLLFLSDIRLATVIDEAFDGPREGYKRGDREMREILAEL